MCLSINKKPTQLNKELKHRLYFFFFLFSYTILTKMDNSVLAPSIYILLNINNKHNFFNFIDFIDFINSMNLIDFFNFIDFTWFYRLFLNLSLLIITNFLQFFCLTSSKILISYEISMEIEKCNDGLVHYTKRDGKERKH